MNRGKPAYRKTLGELVRFGIVGVVATAVHYGIYRGLMTYMAPCFTFRSRASLSNGVGFGAAHVVNYILQMLLLNVYIRFGIPEDVAPFPVYAVAVPVNFMLVRLVFTRKNKK